MASKNEFEIWEDRVIITNKNWKFAAEATVRKDYIDELQSLTWSNDGHYLRSSKLKCKLHTYVMRKWYGDEMYEKMASDGYVVDHMDNNGYNCSLNNLCFLKKNLNTAKGQDLDIKLKKREEIALTITKDFKTSLFQIVVLFNYPAVAKGEGIKRPTVIEQAYLLYDSIYEKVLNDANKIFIDYNQGHYFEPDKLSMIDYEISGREGVSGSLEKYREYVSMELGGPVFLFTKKAPLPNWSINDERKRCDIRKVLK